MNNIKKCALCKQERKLCKSHIIPKFYFDWLKKTSATGYLRSAHEPNKRQQDGLKEYLLCADCENIFSKFEKYFADTFFYPYLNDYVDEILIDNGSCEPIQYDENLRRFALSIQWRHLSVSRVNTLQLYQKNTTLIENIKENWRKYLLNVSSIEPHGETYMILLSNPKNMKILDAPYQNGYLLRTCDLTLGENPQNELFVCSKFGPFILLTGLQPQIIPNLLNTRIRKSGKFLRKFELSNDYITKFIFQDRPRLLAELYKMSDSQNEKIRKSVFSNLKRAKNSLTFKILESDRSKMTSE